MNNSYKRDENYKILGRAVKLCQSIEPYVDLLGLNWYQVRNFKDEIQTIMYVTENFKSFADSFFLFNKNTISVTMELLIHQCVTSINYTQNIGRTLGIVKDVNFNVSAFRELTFVLNQRN